VPRGTFTLTHDAHACAQQIEVRAENTVADGYRPVPDHDNAGDLVYGYTPKCNMGGCVREASQCDAWTRARQHSAEAGIGVELTSSGAVTPDSNIFTNYIMLSRSMMG
jgi:hypothetical protein